MASIAATHQYDVPARASSWTARWIRRLRVVLCLAEMTQQIHSLRASGVRSFQAARVVASELRTLRTSTGVLCRPAGLLSLFTGVPRATVVYLDLCRVRVCFRICAAL